MEKRQTISKIKRDRIARRNEMRKQSFIIGSDTSVLLVRPIEPTMHAVSLQVNAKRRHRRGTNGRGVVGGTRIEQSSRQLRPDVQRQSEMGQVNKWRWKKYGKNTNELQDICSTSWKTCVRLSLSSRLNARREFRVVEAATTARVCQSDGCDRRGMFGRTFFFFPLLINLLSSTLRATRRRRCTKTTGRQV